MFRLAFKSVRHNPKRLILTAIAVALGVSLVSASFTFTNALSNGFSELFSEIYSAQDIIVEPDPEAAPNSEDPFAAPEALLSSADVDAVLAVPGVALAAGGIQVPATVLPADPDPDAPPAFGPPDQLFNWTGQPEFDQSVLVDGAEPANDGEIVLDLDSIERLGYAIGDQVTVAAEEGLELFTLVGSVRFGEDNDLQGATLGYFTDADAHRLAGTENYAQIAVIVDEGANSEAVAATIQEVIPEGTRAITTEQKAAEETAQLDDVLRIVNIITLVFAVISLFVGGYIIVNTFRVIVTQRTRELGLLRAIGVSGKQIRSMILGEAFVVGVVASTLGLASGFVLAFVIAKALGAVAADVFGTVTLPWEAVALSYGLGLLVTMVSALIPAIHASSISPMEALRDSATSGKKPLRTRNVVGAALTLLGALAVAVGLNAPVSLPAVWVGLGAVTIVIGVTLLAAQVLVPMAYGLRGWLTSWFGVDGKLAANNIRREPRRSANTAAALMIGVMLLALVSTLTESVKASFTEQFKQINAEFFVLPTQGDIPEGALNVIGGVDGVDFVTTVGIGSAQVDGVTYSVGVIEPELADAAIDFNNEPDFTEMDGGVFIDPVIQALGVKVGDQITVVGTEATETLTVTGLYLVEGDANLWVDPAVGATLFGDVPIYQALIVLDEGADAAEVQDGLTAALSVTYPTLLVQAPAEFQQFINTFVNILITIVSGLLFSAVVIALLGVANTLLLSVTERTREIGLLRAVGMKRGSIWRMITVESIVMAIFGTILGMILGVTLGVALMKSLEEYALTEVKIPWIWLIAYTVLAAIAGVLAAIWPAWRASRLDILKAIAADG